MTVRAVSLRLTLSAGTAASGAPVDRSVPLAESDDGSAIVRGWFEFPVGEIAVTDLALYRFSANRDVVTAHPVAAASRENVFHSFYATVIPLIAWVCDGVEVFHASAVETPGGVLALCGASGSGKSTLAHALADRGLPRFAEDALAFTVGPAGVRAVPLPFTVNLREPARGHFTAAGKLPQPAPAEMHLPPGSERPLASLVMLDPTDTVVAPALVRLQPSEALLALLPNAHRFRNQPAERERQMLEAYLTLVTDVPLYRLAYTQRFEGLEDLLDLIQGAVPA